jgi:DNA-binding transcriptional LysR family regulator
MDTANLQAFVKIAETGSFSVAANELFITQPAISKRIKQLESQLGSQLIDRIGKHSQLTQTGKVLLPRARQILQDIDSVKQQISDLEGNPMGALSMATSHHIGLHRLPPVLREFNQRFAEVELDLNFMDSERACRLIEHNELELAVVTLPFKSSDKLTFKTVWNDRLVVCCAPDHHLSQIESPRLQNLTEHPAVLPSHGTFTRDAIEQALKPVRGELVINMETNYLETIKMMVSVGLGWSILPASMMDKTLHQVALGEFHSSRTLGVVLNRQRSLSKAAEAMLELLEKFSD